ncbi:MAG: PilX N-terminal domain-containing pilus assembly protein [Burkholderiaceae bacterium]|nr:PilX N-terminal domain-containing pilus assembly protein [Burkholderiaceae bacterium]
MTNHKQKLNPHKQSGAILFTSLIFLLVLSMLVLAALRTGTLEERMAANARNRQVALQAAEAVLRNAEVTLFTGAAFTSNFDSYPDSSGNLSNGFYMAPSAATPLKWKSVDWSDASKTLTNGAALSGVVTQPRYIVEIITRPTRPNSTVPCSKGLLSVTARGLGRDSADVFVHAMYRYQSDRAADGC